MSENKMAEVAKLFGKKMGEEFVVKDRYRTEWCKFTEHGLLCLDKAFSFGKIVTTIYYSIY